MIRWITAQVGTSAWGDDVNSDTSPLDVRDLVDGSGNALQDVRAKIDEGVRVLASGQKVVVLCDYGISRSNAIAAGVIALSRGSTFDDALALVLAQTGEESIKLQMAATVRRALEEAPPRSSGAGGLLVTGGNGFLGTRLVASLGSGREVVAPTHAQVDLLRSPVPLDRLVRESEVDTLVHLAYPRVLTTNGAIGEATTAMKNVLDVCVENGLHLFLMSSWEVFSGYRGPHFVVADEALELQPGGTYGYGKALCESLVEHLAKATGLRNCIIRSGPVFGTGSDRPRFIQTFTKKAVLQEPIIVHSYRNGLPHLDLLPVDALVDGLVAAIEARLTGKVHLGFENPISTTDIARRIVEVLDSNSPIVTRQVDADAPKIVMASSRARSELGWTRTSNTFERVDELAMQIAASVRTQPGVREPGDS